MAVASPSSRCFHCGLPTPGGDAPLEEAGHVFCCTGCLSAYQLIQSAGLDEFYRRRDQEGVGGRPEEGDEDALRVLDSDEVTARYVRRLGEECETSLLLEGMHCAACVWLNEQVLRGVPGVVLARVNFSTHRATIRWDPQQTSLSRIARAVRRIGYRAEPYDPDTVEERHRQRDRDLLVRLGVAGFGAGNTMMLAVALYAGYFSGIDAPVKQFFHWISLLLATPVLWYGGWPFLRGAWNGLRVGHLNMDLPIALGALVTYLYSVWVTLGGVGEVYFDSVTMFLFFLLTGRYLESAARRKAAGAAERLLNMAPRTATVVRDGQDVTLPVREVAVGEVVVVKPGEQIPLDGEVLEGWANVDESLLTGESLPVLKGVGAPVAGGTLNLDGALQVRVTRVSEESAIARIVRLVETAQAARPPIQSLADRVAGWFVGTILLLAVATFLYWLPVDPAQALTNTVALLIITCPCALGLATPAAVIVATGTLAQRGILVKEGGVLERLAAVTAVALDKTGTVTEGVARLAALQPAPGVGEAELLGVVAAVERFSEHPLGAALVRAAAERGCTSGEEASWFQNHPGMGIEAGLAGRTVVVGRPGWVAERLGGGALTPPAGVALSWVACAADDRLLGWVGLSDRVRADAGQAVAGLRALGIDTLLLSGDRAAVVGQVAAQVGIGAWLGESPPGGKEAEIARRQGLGQVVAMVGDGINDAPALARADVSCAVENATDVSLETAQVVLLNHRLTLVPEAIALARNALRVIKQNFLFSLVYNLIAIPLAMAGLVLPIVGAIAMPLSSLVVVGNALRLRRL